MGKTHTERLGFTSRKMTVNKHVAIHADHLRALIKRLDDDGDTEAADTIVWLIWWLDVRDERFARLKEDYGNALNAIADAEAKMEGADD